MAKKDTYNYRALYRHSYTIRGVTAKKLGGISYAFSLETATVVLLTLILEIPLVIFVHKFDPALTTVVAGGTPWLVLKTYNSVNPDGLKVHQWFIQYAKYLWYSRVKKRHLNNDVEVYFMEDDNEIVIN